MSDDGHDRVGLEPGDFRRERMYLAPHLFLDGGEAPEPPPDLLPVDSWESLMTLPTDVLLRTTAQYGTKVHTLHRHTSTWSDSSPIDFETTPYRAMSFLDAQEELEACIFNLLHGYYRPAISCLRAALENFAGAAALHIAQDAPRQQLWLSGRGGAEWGYSLRTVRRSSPLSTLTRAAWNSTFSTDKSSWLGALYEALSGYTHGLPGSTAGDLWRSNGPVLNSEALGLVADLFERTVVALYLLRLVFGVEKPTPDSLSALAARYGLHEAVASLLAV